jgi:hypothetical protein
MNNSDYNEVAQLLQSLCGEQALDQARNGTTSILGAVAAFDATFVYREKKV